MFIILKKWGIIIHLPLSMEFVMWLNRRDRAASMLFFSSVWFQVWVTGNSQSYRKAHHEPRVSQPGSGVPMWENVLLTEIGKLSRESPAFILARSFPSLSQRSTSTYHSSQTAGAHGISLEWWTSGLIRAISHSYLKSELRIEADPSLKKVSLKQ